MSLYNILFGSNPLSSVLLKMIDVPAGEIPRFRDAYLEGDSVVIYTRTGGGNDECYCETEGNTHEEGCYYEANRKLEGKDNFISMEYDDFDSTYAYFRFSVKAEHQEHLEEIKALSGDNPPQSVSEKFQEFIKNMK